MNISGRTVFFPGATCGIGLGLARRFAGAGSTVIIGGRQQQLIDEITAGHERSAPWRTKCKPAGREPTR